MNLDKSDAAIICANIDEVAAAINICFGQFDAPGQAAALRLAAGMSDLRRRLQSSKKELFHDAQPLSAPEKDTVTHAQGQDESIPARALLETEVPHGAAAGRETHSEENRTQGCLQHKPKLHTNGSATPQQHGRPVSLSTLNHQPSTR